MFHDCVGVMMMSLDELTTPLPLQDTLRQVELEVTYGHVTYSLRGIYLHKSGGAGHYYSIFRDVAGQWWFCDGMGLLERKPTCEAARQKALEYVKEGNPSSKSVHPLLYFYAAVGLS
jgi:hypothetical protein